MCCPYSTGLLTELPAGHDFCHHWLQRHFVVYCVWKNCSISQLLNCSIARLQETRTLRRLVRLVRLVRHVRLARLARLEKGELKHAKLNPASHRNVPSRPADLVCVESIRKVLNVLYLHTRPYIHGHTYLIYMPTEYGRVILFAN